jgi:thiopeptide-type bacteriocin biosynthesis protein
LLIEPPFELPVDLDNVLAVDALARAVRAGRGARIEELFPGPSELPVRGPEGAFVHELVVPFVRSRPRARRARTVAHASVERTFPPGSEWVYARLYLGETMADRVLTDAIAPQVRDLLASGTVDRWFFLRYRDPEFHLRVRFHGDARLAVEALGADLVRRGQAWRIELGTYEREVERYGGPEAIELVERMFHADSDAVLELLARLEPGEEGQEERWRIALVGAHRLLVDLGLEGSDRFAVVSELRTSRGRELGWGHTEWVKIGKRFRVERDLLAQLLESAPAEPSLLALGQFRPGLEVLEARSRVVTPLGDELRKLDLAGRLTVPLTDVASSLLHMHLNRILRGDNIAQEAVICDFLARMYEAGAKRGSQPKSS